MADGDYGPERAIKCGPGILYIVSTPIGNLEDITLRALRILGEIDLIAAEDTRQTRKLLAHYRIKKPITSYFEHNKILKGKEILSKLLEGKHVALTSDAGTPGVSDPGYHLVNLAISKGIEVVPIPGPTAAIAALSVSGLPTDRFIFEGFLPPKGAKRERALLRYLNEESTSIFYESPHRLVRFLEDVLHLLGNRKVVVAREITKLYEEIQRGTAQEISEHYRGKKIRGEITILLGGVEKKKK